MIFKGYDMQGLRSVQNCFYNQEFTDRVFCGYISNTAFTLGNDITMGDEKLSFQNAG